MRGSLAEIDADAAAVGAAALVALDRGYAPERIKAAALAADPEVRVEDIRSSIAATGAAVAPRCPPAATPDHHQPRGGSPLRPLQPDVYRSTAIVRLPDTDRK